MKILVVASTMVHIKNFHLPYINEFKKAGHDVYVMASGEGADFDIPFKKNAFSLKNFRLSFKIRKILKKERFDAVYLHTTLAAFWTRFAMWGMKRPLVVNTVHGYLFSNDTSGIKSKLFVLAEKIMRKRTDYIFAMNRYDFYFAKSKKLCKKEVYLIDGMGVDFSRVSSFSKKQRDDNMLKLVFVGEISKRKNQMFLVKSLLKLENAHLTLVGDGDEREAIESFARKHSILNRMEITGFTKNVKQYLENADIYVSAAVIEGLPFNIMEAMAAKMPIVASDIKGHRELLPSHSLYPLNDENAFVELVKITTLEPKEYDIERYRLENVLGKNVNLYLSLDKC